MKHLILLLLLIISANSWSQTLTDIAATMNINDIQNSANHWANGGTFYDFNEDGWDDLVLPVNNDSLVFYQNFNGNLVKIDSYVYAPGQVRQVTWVDFDDNGTLDLCVTYHDIGVRLYSNNGGFNFTDVTSSLGISTAPFSAYGVAFADADQDGDLDFYVCAYETVQVHGPNASNNLYYVNNNNVAFTEEAMTYGINNGAQPSFMPVWFDFDNDGDLDLHVINDREYSGDAFYENENGFFTDISVASGTLNYGHNPMSISISDFDNDADFDIFESDVANGAISSGTPVDYKMFRNNNGANFTNVASNVGVDTNFFAWGGLWVDYDNDCFEDLYVATSFTDAQLINERSSVFYRNNGGVDFTNQTDSVIGDLVCSSYCPLKGDLDNDGYYDVIVVNDGVPAHVFTNSGGTNNYIKITPKGSVSNNNAIGSRVEVFANGEHQSQMVFCGHGICAQNSQHKIFGIGTATVVDSVIVTYPSGLVRKEYDLPANNSYELLEQSTVYVQLTQTGNVLQACIGDTVELSVPGYYDYEWSTGANQSSIEVTTSGYYNVTAENLAGDTVIVSNNLYVNFNGPMGYQEIITDAPCGNSSFGSVEIIPNNANLVDSVIWSDGYLGTFHDSLLVGNYDYTIVSIYGCAQQESVSIAAIPPFTTQYVTDPFTDTSEGSIEIFIWGGTAPFEFVMDGNIVSNNITDLSPGNYEVTVTDALGCSQVIPFTIVDQSTTGLENLSDSDFNIYVSDNTLFVCSDGEISKADVALYDVTGKRINNDMWHQNAIECVYRSCELMRGLYVVKIQQDAGVYSKKVFIQ